MKPNLVNGFDISHYNGSVNFSQMAQLGHKFCFIKCTDGATVVDQQFKTNWTNAPFAGLFFGAYHFFRPQVDPQLQAEHFLNVKGANKVGELPCVLDFETLDGVSIGQAKTRALIWLDIVERVTGKKPIFYSYRSFIAEGGDWSKFVDYPLWLALYSPKVVSPASQPPWAKWTFWQYTDENGLDLNVLNGSLSIDDLNKMAGK